MDLGIACLVALLASAALVYVSAECTGTPERPAHLLTLTNGQNFCLKLPRYLPNPVKADFGGASFARTSNDTVGPTADDGGA